MSYAIEQDKYEHVYAYMIPQAIGTSRRGALWARRSAGVLRRQHLSLSSLITNENNVAQYSFKYKPNVDALLDQKSK